MSISSINDKKMCYKHYMKQPKHMVEIELNQILAIKLHFITFI